MLAVRRVKGLKRLEAVIKKGLAADEEDRQLVTIWTNCDLQGSSDAQHHAKRLKLAATRIKLWQALKKALREADPIRVSELNQNRVLHDYPPYTAHRDDIERLAEDGAWCFGILKSLEEDDAQTFVDSFKRTEFGKAKRRYPERFASRENPWSLAA